MCPRQRPPFFDALVDRAARIVRVVALRHGIAAPETHDDLTQEVLCHFLHRVRERPHALATIEDWNAVIARVAYWRTMDHLRATGRARQALALEAGPPDTPLAFVSPAPARDTAGRRETLQRFHREAGLDALTWQVVEGRLDGHAFQNLAANLGLSVNACTLRYHRFAQAFRAWWRHGGPGESP